MFTRRARSGPKREVTADVVIIGAGVIGLSIGFHAAHRGLRTVVVDCSSKTGTGSTGTSPGIVRFHAADRQACVLALEGARAYWDWCDFVAIPVKEPLVEFHRSGSLLLSGSDGYAAKADAVMSSVGISTEALDSKSLATVAPWLSTRRHGTACRADGLRKEESERLSGIYTPSAGIVRTPQLVLRDLACSFMAAGGRLLLGKRVTQVLTQRERVAGVCLNAAERIAAPVVVNASGPHSSQVNEMAHVSADMKVGTRPLRHQMHRAKAPILDFDAAGCHVSDGDLEINFWPDGQGAVAVGLEGAIAGNLAAADPDSPEATTDECFRETVRRLALRFPGVDSSEATKGWSGLFDVTDDWIPIYDRTGLEGFYLAIGTSGNQFKAAPVVGHLLVELILACESGYRHDDHPLVVVGPRTDELIDIGHYSRLRNVTGGPGSLNG